MVKRFLIGKDIITILLRVKLKSRPREPEGYKTKEEGTLCFQQIEKPKSGHPFPHALDVRGVAFSGQVSGSGLSERLDFLASIGG